MADPLDLPRLLARTISFDSMADHLEVLEHCQNRNMGAQSKVQQPTRILGTLMDCCAFFNAMLHRQEPLRPSLLPVVQSRSQY